MFGGRTPVAPNQDHPQESPARIVSVAGLFCACRSRSGVRLLAVVRALLLTVAALASTLAHRILLVLVAGPDGRPQPTRTAPRRCPMISRHRPRSCPRRWDAPRTVVSDHRRGRSPSGHSGGELCGCPAGSARPVRIVGRVAVAFGGSDLAVGARSGHDILRLRSGKVQVSVWRSYFLGKRLVNRLLFRAAPLVCRVSMCQSWPQEPTERSDQRFDW